MKPKTRYTYAVQTRLRGDHPWQDVHGWDRCVRHLDAYREMRRLVKLTGNWHTYHRVLRRPA